MLEYIYTFSVVVLLLFCNSCSIILQPCCWFRWIFHEICRYLKSPGFVWFTRSHWLGIYNLANHNKVSPSEIVARQTQLGFSNPTRTARKIAVKSFKILTLLKTRNSDGNLPSCLCQSISYISVVVACL